MTLTPKRETVTVWGRIEFVIDKETLLPSEQSYFNEKGEKVRNMEFSEIRDYSGRKMPSIMTMLPLNKEGHKTVIEYIEAEFDTKVDPRIFTLRNLQARF